MVDFETSIENSSMGVACSFGMREISFAGAR
jgi:hypothetical protein